MRFRSSAPLRLFLAIFCAFAVLPALAQTDLSAKSLDDLFRALKLAPDRATATTITSEIWKRWTTPADPALAMQMQELLHRRTDGDLTGARAIADTMIAAHPDYAEGWNQRATLNYLLGKYQASLADIAETLKREPRHFGAMSGKVLILLKLGDEAEARKTLIKALAIDPFLSERRLFPDLGPPPIRT